MAAHKRKVFLTDPEIREYEAMDAGQISAHFFTAGVDKASQIVRSVIASYRITARVANASWGLLQGLLADPAVLRAIENNPALVEEVRKLQAALNDYSPGNWPPARTEREYAAHVLVKLYELAASMPSWESSLEKIYEAATREYETIT